MYDHDYDGETIDCTTVKKTFDFNQVFIWFKTNHTAAGNNDTLHFDQKIVAHSLKKFYVLIKSLKLKLPYRL